jgi:hypothetical protein
LIMICPYDSTYCKHPECGSDGCRRAAWPMQAPGEVSGELTVQRQGVVASHDSLSTEAEDLADDRTGHEEA